MSISNPITRHPTGVPYRHPSGVLGTDEWLYVCGYFDWVGGGKPYGTYSPRVAAFDGVNWHAYPGFDYTPEVDPVYPIYDVAVSTGVAVPGVLITRNADDNGRIMVQTESAPTFGIGASVDVYWPIQAGHSRRTMTVDGQPVAEPGSIDVSGGTGKALPVESSAVYVTYTNAYLGVPTLWCANSWALTLAGGSVNRLLYVRNGAWHSIGYPTAEDWYNVTHVSARLCGAFVDFGETPGRQYTLDEATLAGWRAWPESPPPAPYGMTRVDGIATVGYHYIHGQASFGYGTMQRWENGAFTGVGPSDDGGVGSPEVKRVLRDWNGDTIAAGTFREASGGTPNDERYAGVARWHPEIGESGAWRSLNPEDNDWSWRQQALQSVQACVLWYDLSAPGTGRQTLWAFGPVTSLAWTDTTPPGESMGAWTASAAWYNRSTRRWVISEDFGYPATLIVHDAIVYKDELWAVGNWTDDPTGSGIARARLSTDGASAIWYSGGSLVGEGGQGHIGYSLAVGPPCWLQGA